MQPSNSCYEFIKSFEGLFLEAYQDSVGIWTIGWGTIKYPNGTKVKEGDICTEEQAQEYLEFEVNEKSHGVNAAIKEIPLNQGQYDALVSFCYNLGSAALQTSTLLKKLLKNPHDSTIYEYSKDENGKPIADSCEFCKWCRANGRILWGLLRRRAAEANMYGNKNASIDMPA